MWLAPLEGALSPDNCRRSEAEKDFPCSKLQGIHKLKLSKDESSE